MRDGIKPQNLRHYQIKRLQMEIKNDETEHFSILPFDADYYQLTLLPVSPTFSIFFSISPSLGHVLS